MSQQQPKASRPQARANMYRHMDAARRRLDTLRQEVAGFLSGVEDDPDLKSRTVDQEVSDRAAAEAGALDAALAECEQVVERLSHIIWTEL